MAETKKAPTKATKTAAKKAPAKAVAEKTPAKKAAATEISAKKKPTHDEIAKLANKYYHERGGHHGSDAHDWLRAEHELSK